MPFVIIMGQFQDFTIFIRIFAKNTPIDFVVIKHIFDIPQIHALM